jgi:hypothetical protein
MKVYIKGKGEIDLDKNDYIASGGEGSIYAKGNKAFKIYTEERKMIPIGKINELSVLTSPNIIKPEDVICNSKGTPIGYTMKMLNDSYSLCQLFTKAFRDRNNISHAMMFDLIKELQDIVKHVHEKGLLIVDLNEMNFLTSKDFKNIFAIDVDSYQTATYPATAIMESIRDRHSINFTKETDWFSFGIVSFQMFIGIHPYKGKYPKMKDMENRMIYNVSVLNKDVSVPAVCYDFNIIPKNWLAWYKATFEEGKRLPPPFDGEIIQIAAIAKKIIGTNNFDITILHEYNSDILVYITQNGNRLTFTRNSIYLNDKELDSLQVKSGVLGFTNKMCYPIIGVKTADDKVSLFNAYTKTTDLLDINCKSIMAYDGRIYIQNASNILEVKCTEIGSKVLYSTKKVGSVVENGSLVFSGVIIQDILGTFYASLFPKADNCYQIRLKELEGYRIIDAKYSSKILMVIASHKGKYDRFIFKFNEDYSEYVVSVVKDIQPVGINFIVLDSGIVININEEEKMEIFSNDKNSTSMKIIEDPNISSDMKLYKDGNTVVFSRDNKLFKIKMK